MSMESVACHLNVVFSRIFSSCPDDYVISADLDRWTGAKIHVTNIKAAARGCHVEPESILHTSDGRLVFHMHGVKVFQVQNPNNMT